MTLFRDDDKAHEAARDRLESEPIIWLSTVTGTGQPQATPVWFIWTAGEVVIYGARNGPKNRNIAANPRVCLHLDGDGRGVRLDPGQLRQGLPACDPSHTDAGAGVVGRCGRRTRRAGTNNCAGPPKTRQSAFAVTDITINLPMHPARYANLQVDAEIPDK